MKQLVTITALLIFAIAFPQKPGTWYSFDEKVQGESLQGSLRGFKDGIGNVKIEPKFTGFTMATRFDDLIAVTEETDGKWDSYYLLKDGTKFGKDSLFVFDFSFDCESEGFIKFHDRKNDKVGMFGKNGKVAIPAVYNAMSKFKNGIAVALAGAEKVHMKHDHSDCDHWYYDGGIYYLINTNNEILIENFKPGEEIDYHSMQVSTEESTDETRVSFEGIDGNYYSFTNNKKLFEKFLLEEIIKNISHNKLIEHSWPELIHSSPEGWVSEDSREFINNNFDVIAEILNSTNDKSFEYSIEVDDNILCPDRMDSQFDHYRDNCGELDVARYPLMEIYINYKGHYETQKSFTFLKTEEGFKLLSLSLGSELK
ncbi:hypothetical protein OGH69_17205 [Flavobacterium sp. MFBS3-15]|uniref:hypothetical protein n=1 Tax=Flavobacterium sp. MFBS3-15 TaxID=2989816 RepID=UPI002235C068|nr:hypothetical protein [Flavobacterium sp. MFBS3-15]MCW4470713.1 hypothetical protein [Flavobacterium sp. MFBS3-15]